MPLIFVPVTKFIDISNKVPVTKFMKLVF
jgi:hypothetical protein